MAAGTQDSCTGGVASPSSHLGYDLHMTPITHSTGNNNNKTDKYDLYTDLEMSNVCSVKSRVLRGIVPLHYREANGGAGYRKLKEYGEESGKRAGILWMKRRVYAVIWEKEREVGGRAAREEGDNEYRRRPPVRAIVVGSDREQSVTSNNSGPSTCGAGSVRTAEGNDVEQQPKAAWAWKR